MMSLSITDDLLNFAVGSKPLVVRFVIVSFQMWKGICRMKTVDTKREYEL